jgi:hypothetical protein
MAAGKAFDFVNPRNSQKTDDRGSFIELMSFRHWRQSLGLTMAVALTDVPLETIELPFCEAGERFPKPAGDLAVVRSVAARRRSAPAKPHKPAQRKQSPERSTV